MNTRSIFLVLCCLTAFPSYAQHVPTLEEVVNGGLIVTKGESRVNWLSEGNSYSKKEKNPAGGYDIVSYTAGKNKREVLIPASMFVKPGTSDTLSVRSFSFDTSHKQVLVYTNTRRVWRYDTRGDYWVLNMETGKLRQLGAQLPESSLMFAKLSPDGTRVAYVSGNNIYVEYVSDGKVVQLTHDGSSTIVNGTFDWVYEEEFSCRDGFRWSPDGKYIAYWQSDTEGTGWFDIINNVDSLYPKILRFPYPKAGTTNSAVKVGYVAASGGETTWIDLPGDPRQNYIMRMDFIPESNDLFIQQMNRPQNTNKVWIATIGGGAPKNILTETDAAWVETNDQVTWLKNNTYFTWQSERSGWRHLYRVSRDGKDIQPITKGEFDFIEQVGMDVKKGLVYFIASPDNYTQRYLYSAELLGKGEVKRLSPMDEQGQHRYDLSPDGKYAVHTFSNSVTHPRIEMVALPSHKTVSVIEDNQKAASQYRQLQLSPKEFVKTRSGELQLDAWMIKPVNFEPSKKYPVIEYIYSGPGDQYVPKTFSSYNWWMTSLAELGFIVVQVDGMTTSFRSKEFEEVCYKNLKDAGLPDHIAWIKAAAQKYPYMDIDRVGIFGCSAGGQESTGAVLFHPEFYKAAYSACGCHDNRMDKIWWNELWMGYPVDESYSACSNVDNAHLLSRPLMLVVGELDDNVDPASTMQVANALIKANKDFELVVIPGAHHTMGEDFGEHKRYDFFVRHLMGVTPPSWDKVKTGK